MIPRSTQKYVGRRDDVKKFHFEGKKATLTLKMTFRLERLKFYFSTKISLLPQCVNLVFASVYNFHFEISMN